MKKHVYEICVGVILLIAVLACTFGSGGLPEPETDFRFAVLVVFPDQAIFKGEKIPGALYDFCWPPNTGGSGSLMVDPNGGLGGGCEGKSKDGLLVRKGFLNGEYNVIGGFVDFKVETTIVFTPHAEGKTTSKIVFTAKGDLKGKSVSGIGDFSYTCDTEGKLIACLPGRTTLNTSGTMPFQLDFSR